MKNLAASPHVPSMSSSAPIGKGERSICGIISIGYAPQSDASWFATAAPCHLDVQLVRERPASRKHPSSAFPLISGKLKSSIAGSLISQFTESGDLIYDPFSGLGTVALEAWTAGRNVLATDLSPYAALLTRAKLFPYPSLDIALEALERLSVEADREEEKRIDPQKRPRSGCDKFFHPRNAPRGTGVDSGFETPMSPGSCWRAPILGILHHQRPGFLSFP